MPLSCLTRFGIVIVLLFAAVSLVLSADDQDQLKVGVQPDGRIVVPTNQILQPAGKQVTFPGRPVDLALAEEGKTLVIKNMGDLIFLDVATAQIKQILKSPVPFSAVGLLVQGDDVYASDFENHVRLARRQKDDHYEYGSPTRRSRSQKAAERFIPPGQVRLCVRAQVYGSRPTAAIVCNGST